MHTAPIFPGIQNKRRGVEAVEAPVLGESKPILRDKTRSEGADWRKSGRITGRIRENGAKVTRMWQECGNGHFTYST